MEYDSIRKLIDERIEALFPNEKDDYNDDLTYKDIFFPKLEVLLGTLGCIKIHEGKDPLIVFNEAGLSKSDYEALSFLIEEGMKINKQNNSLEILKELNSRSNLLMRSYVNKVRNNIIKNSSNLEEVEKFDKKVKEFFNDNENIFTPCYVYEKECIKNNVK